MTKKPTNQSAEQLKGYIDGIENYEADKREINVSIKEIFAAAKADRFDTKIMKKIVALRKKDKATLQEERALMETYCEALQYELF